MFLKKGRETAKSKGASPPPRRLKYLLVPAAERAGARRGDVKPRLVDLCPGPREVPCKVL